jgi:predicted lipoprotein with Yx(FWY)xxD motif
VPTSPPTVGASVSLATGDTAQYGTVLTDGSGMTLYVFFEDTEGQSMCYDACADNWPPLVTDGQPIVEDGVDQGLVDTLQRDDGAMQVTYDGQPLYLHAGDSEPGDVGGFGNGNAWYPVAPDGTPIQMADTNGDAASEY